MAFKKPLSPLSGAGEKFSQMSLMWAFVNTFFVLNILLGIVRNPEEAYDLVSPPYHRAWKTKKLTYVKQSKNSRVKAEKPNGI